MMKDYYVDFKTYYAKMVINDFLDENISVLNRFPTYAMARRMREFSGRDSTGKWFECIFLYDGLYYVCYPQTFHKFKLLRSELMRREKRLLK